MSEQQMEEKPRRNVIIAMDGSKHAIYAFEWYVEHIYKDTDKVIMAHYAEIDVKLPTLMGSQATIHAKVKEHEDEVNKVFKTIEELANKHNIKHMLERLDKPPKPGEAIVKAAEQHNANLIIVGSRGLGTLRRTIMGSTSDYIVHHARAPVIVCKHEDEREKLQ